MLIVGGKGEELDVGKMLRGNSMEDDLLCHLGSGGFIRVC